MADKPAEKKPEKKPAASEQSLEQKLVVFFGVIIMVVLIVIPAVLAFFNFDSASIFNMANLKEFFISAVSKTFVYVTFFAVFFSLVFFLALSYAKSRHRRVMDYWKKNVASQMPGMLGAGNLGAIGNVANQGEVIGQIVLPGSMGSGAAGTAAVHGPEAQAGNSVWLEVEQKINSVNPSDWRLAILEADILLFEMLEQMGLPGQNLGEKLKAADSSFFSTLNEAWQAHKVRNIIAHEGASYQLAYNEAKRVIDLYRRVFEEFFFI
jgi:hypothetical protein